MFDLNSNEFLEKNYSEAQEQENGFREMEEDNSEIKETQYSIGLDEMIASNEGETEDAKPKNLVNKKIIGIGIILIIFVILIGSTANFLIKFYHAYDNLKTIQTLVNNRSYVAAYNELINYNTRTKSAFFKKDADSMLESLQQMASIEYEKGLSILKNDKTDSYSETVSFFNEFIRMYGYKNTGTTDKANELLKIIHTRNEDVSELKKQEANIDAYKNGLEICNRFSKNAEEVKKLHEYYDSAINSGDSAMLSVARYSWLVEGDAAKFKNILDDVINSEQECISQNIFSKEQYNTIKKFFAYGMLPAFTYNDAMNSGQLDETLRQNTLDGWNAYPGLETKTLDILEQTSRNLEDYVDRYDTLKSRIYSNETKINTFKESMAPIN